MEFVFTDDCKIGVSVIDSEHQYLFELMNNIIETLNGDWHKKEGQHGIEEYAELLKDYGKVHFKHEEEYLEKTNDIELKMQKMAHATFMQKMDSLDFLDLDNEEKRAMLSDMLRYLTKWLYSHIIGSDTMIGKVEDVAKEICEDAEFTLFTDKYLTGIEQVDEEHRKLFDIIERTFRLVEGNDVEHIYDDILNLMDELEEYTEYHFAHEEEYMEEIHYPGLEEQRHAHAIFLDKLRERDYGEKLENHKEFLEEMLDFLYAWLGNHILKMDKKIGQFH